MSFMNAKRARPVDDPKALVPFGWAPGGYHCAACAMCGEAHSGSDKRSMRCQDCAEALRDAPPPMTHPLTPREKALGQIAYDGWAQGLPGCEWDNQTETQKRAWSKAADAILTALASGSGDHAELARLKAAMSKSNDEICQSLGKALGYPWFKDDQRNFPGATEGNGVCVGDHVAESIADEAASRISAILAENAALRGEREDAVQVIEAEREDRELIEGRLTARATEAERKLAEAVGLLREWMGTWFVDADSREENAIADDTRKFLSKEAERG